MTAVGGTTLTQATATARLDRDRRGPAAGSGCSTVYAKPSWQTRPSAARCAWRPTSRPSPIRPPASRSTGRTAAASRPGWSSAARASPRPLVGGIYGANGGAVTYGSDPYAHTGALNDVTSGTNGACSAAGLLLPRPKSATTARPASARRSATRRSDEAIVCVDASKRDDEGVKSKRQIGPSRSQGGWALVYRCTCRVQAAPGVSST